MSFGDKPFGLRNIVLKNGATTVTLPAARTLTFKERVKSGEFQGDDTVQGVHSYPELAEWEIEHGGISLEAYALMTGRTVVSAGVTPDQTKTLTGKAADLFPYFEIYGQSIGDEGADDVHVHLFKAKLTEAPNGDFKYGEFFATKIKGSAVDDGTNGIFEFVQEETSTVLP